MNTQLNTIQDLLGPNIIVKEQVLLKPYSTFKMGGPAEYYVEAHSEDELITIHQVAQKLGLPIRLLGGASNIVIHDKGIKGLVIRNLASTRSILRENATEVDVHISSGYSMTRLAKETAELGWEGFEHHLGLPGTLGGALYMNSKWVGNDTTYYVGDHLIRALLISPEGKLQEVNKDYFNFGYDYSILQESGEHVIWAEYRLKKTDPEELIKQGKEALEYRKKTQPFGVATSGCFFKNVQGESAGKMIDDEGLKGMRVGGAVVSDVHANFILNDGTATTKDVEELIRIIKDKIKEKHNIELEQEVSII